MNCESRQDQLLLYALGTLDGPEGAEVRAHLATGCPICQGRLAENQATLALLPLGVKSVEPPAHAKQRLMDRILEAKTSESVPRAHPPQATVRRPTLSFRIGPYLIGGAVAACVTVLIFLNIVTKMSGRIQSLAEINSAKSEELRQVQARLDNTSNLIRQISSPETKVVELKSTAKQPGAETARLIWDPLSGQVHLFAAGMKPLAPGKAYELWLIGKKSPVPAGTFRVDETGNGTVAMNFPQGSEQFGVGAVSEEQWNDGKGVLQPTMSAVKLMGKIE